MVGHPRRSPLEQTRTSHDFYVTGETIMSNNYPKPGQQGFQPGTTGQVVPRTAPPVPAAPHTPDSVNTRPGYDTMHAKVAEKVRTSIDSPPEHRGGWKIQTQPGTDRPERIQVEFDGPSDGPWRISSKWKPEYENEEALHAEICAAAKELLRAVGENPTDARVEGNKIIVEYAPANGDPH